MHGDIGGSEGAGACLAWGWGPSLAVFGGGGGTLVSRGHLVSS